MSTMGRADGYGTCANCDATLAYCLIHNGFNDSAFAYCDRCGATALFDRWSKAIPGGVELKLHGPIDANVEVLVRPCACGGRFSGVASPRCSKCRDVLDAVAWAAPIERDARGTATGWRWQRTWAGLYAVIIDDRVVNDPWMGGRTG